MKKPEGDRTDEEKEVLEQSQDMVKDIEKRAKLRELNKQRKLEVYINVLNIELACYQIPSWSLFLFFWYINQ